MRKVFFILGTLILVMVAAAAVWIFRGPRIALYVDEFGTVEVSSEPVRFIRYEGNGSGGVLYANDTPLSLNSAVPALQPPSVGSTKDGKLGLASGGKVFPLGKLPANIDDMSQAMAAPPDPGDEARVSVGHSKLSWPTPLALNFMTGSSPSWKRHSYQRLTWAKPNGTKLDMLWRYEQNFDAANGWTTPTLTRDGATGLVKIEIQP